MRANCPCFGVEGLARLAHHRIAMARLGWLFALAICGFPNAALGQSWAEAHTAGDYGRAAELLQQIVIEQLQAAGGGLDLDPVPARHLAVLYARGSGVTREPVLACALARLSDMAVHVRPPEPNQHPLAYQAMVDESERFVRANCEALTDRQQLAAGRSLGCFTFGMREGTLTIGEQTVSFDLLGLRLNESADDPSARELWCLQLVARIDSRTVTPPSDAAPGVLARSFVELLGWQMAGDPPGMCCSGRCSSSEERSWSWLQWSISYPLPPGQAPLSRPPSRCASASK
jgi:hypothetical protein